MMEHDKFSIIISDSATRDLTEIYEYIVFHLCTKRSAEKLLLKIETGIESLATFPERFARYKAEPFCEMGLRFMSIENYVVMYIADKNDGTIQIVRIMYASRNITALLAE